MVGLPVIFNVGDSNQKEVSVQVLEDVVVEDTESFYVDMTSSDAKIVFTNGTRARIDIQDDDRMLLIN